MSATLAMPVPTAYLALRKEATVSPKETRLCELTKQAAEMREGIENHWFDFPDDLRESFRVLAYKLLDGPTASEALLMVVSLFRWGTFLASARHREVAALAVAEMVKLREAILDKIEQENPELQQVIADRVKDYFTGPRDGDMSIEEFRDWAKAL